MEMQSFYSEEGSKFVGKQLFILATRLKKSVTLNPGLSFQFHVSLQITRKLCYGWLIRQMLRCTQSWKWRAECFAERKQVRGIKHVTSRSPSHEFQTGYNLIPNHRSLTTKSLPWMFKICSPGLWVRHPVTKRIFIITDPTKALNSIMSNIM